MLTTAFEQKALQKPGFIQRLLKKQPSENFLVEVNNLFSSKPITTISREEITELISRYGNKLSAATLQGLYKLYEDYLIYCLSDKVLSDEEVAELQHLKEILSLNDNDVRSVHNNITGMIYQKSVREVIADGKISSDEQQFLSTLQQNLLLPDELAEEISKQVRGNFIDEYVHSAVADQRLSPQEEQHLASLCKNLGVALSYTDSTRTQLALFKLYWVVENGEIPEISVPIALGKQEVCYMQTSAEWHELRTVTQRINYQGYSASFKISKGVRYRVGSVRTQRITAEEWKCLDRGMLYLTNKRLIFMGSIKNSTISLSKVLSFTPYANGIEISKDTGRPPMFVFNNNNDLFSLILSRLLNS